MTRIIKKHRAHARRRLLQILVLCITLTALILTFRLIRSPHTRVGQFESPNEISSAMLVETPDRYDGTTVTFMGEAVIERMIRGSGAWLHLNDDAYMYNHLGDNEGLLGGYNSGMPVWVEDATLTDAIEYYGTSKSNGDIVQVVGTYHAACAQHGGDTDIHATSLVIVSRGHIVYERVTSWKILLTGILLLMALAMFLLNRRYIRRELAGLFHREVEDERD